jgi:hypothetical protein
MDWNDTRTAVELSWNAGFLTVHFWNYWSRRILEARVGFEPTNGGFAGRASCVGLFPFSRLGMS